MANIIINSFRSLPKYCINTKIHCISLQSTSICQSILKQTNQQQQLPIRHSSFRSSQPIGEDITKDHPNVEINQNTSEWKYVEAILPKKLIPEPKLLRETIESSTSSSLSSSSWIPQINNTKGMPYFVARTKNHMIPVYLSTYYRGQRKITKIRRIQGDIWHLEKDLRNSIEMKIGKNIASRINEMNGQIIFKGDFVNIINEFLLSKGL